MSLLLQTFQLYYVHNYYTFPIVIRFVKDKRLLLIFDDGGNAAFHES